MERKEAIKVASEMYGWLKTDREREALETLIPELSESDDERVRKGLINFLQSPFIKENLTDEKVAPWIAYLEKQEQKPEPKQAPWIPKFKEDDFFKSQKAKIYEIKRIEQDECVAGYWCERIDVPTIGNVWFSNLEEKCMEPYEPEPEEETEKKWTPKFKAGDLFTYKDPSKEAKLYTVKLVDEQDGCVPGYWCERFDAPTNGNVWFCSSEEEYMKPYEPEPEKEWSEEDKTTIKEICNFLYETSIGVYRSIEQDTFKRWIDCLKSL